MKIDTKELPRRIILSRKGFDSSYGRRPSPIADGELLSLPIPEHKEKTATCPFSPNSHLQFRHLGPTALTNHFGNNTNQCVHLDPDIRPALRPKGASRKGFFFGQSGAAQTHLTNNEVGVNDLFLYFGWFQDEDSKRAEIFPTGKHAIWGWFQIDEPPYKIDSIKAANGAPCDARHHPHVTHWKSANGSPKRGNTLYSATKRLRFAPRLNSAGVFTDSDAVTLTRSHATRSRWKLPSFISETGMTYHQNRLNNGEKHGNFIHIEAAPIGQEFVIHLDESINLKVKEDAALWLSKLFANAKSSN